MNIWKLFLIIVAPLSLLLIVGIMLAANYFVSTQKPVNEFTDFDNENTFTSRVSTVQKNIKKVFVTESEYQNKKNNESSFYDWQNSENIKQANTLVKNNEDQKNSTENIEPENNSEVGEIKNTVPVSGNDFDIWGSAKKEEGADLVSDFIQLQKNSGGEKNNDIRNYVNIYATEIKKFAARHGDQNKIMGDFVKNIGGENNTEAILQLAAEYYTVGNALKLVTPVESFASVGQNLAQAYYAVGAATEKLSTVISEDVLVENLYEYNAVVDEFAKSFVSFSQLLGAYGVTFKSTEAGAVFAPPR